MSDKNSIEKRIDTFLNNNDINTPGENVDVVKDDVADAGDRIKKSVMKAV